MGEGLIASPGASFIFICVNCRLLHLEGTCDQIGLASDATQLVAQTSEAKRIDRAVIDLQLIRAAQHRLARSHEFVGDGYAVESAVEFFFLALDEAGKETEFEVLIAPRDF